MTLPKLLQEKRDQLAELHHDKTNTRIGHYKKGFSEACNILLPEIEKLREALLRLTVRLEESASIHDIKPSAEIVKQALNSWQEFLGDKSEGGNE